MYKACYQHDLLCNPLPFRGGDGMGLLMVGLKLIGCKFWRWMEAVSGGVYLKWAEEGMVFFAQHTEGGSVRAGSGVVTFESQCDFRFYIGLRLYIDRLSRYYTYLYKTILYYTNLYYFSRFFLFLPPSLPPSARPSPSPLVFGSAFPPSPRLRLPIAF